MNNITFVPANSDKIHVMHKVDMADGTYSMHIHNDYEIYMSLCNNNKFCVGHKIYDVNRNDVFLFNNTDVHKINVSNPAAYDRFVVMFSPSLFSKADPELLELLNVFDRKLPNHSHKISLSDVQAEEFLCILNKMAECNREGVYCSFLRLRLYLVQLLIVLQETRHAAHNVAPPVASEDKRISEIMDYIRTHCHYSVTLEELSHEFYLNKYYLCRLFKDKLGFGISEYIESCRLSEAVPMLRQGVPVSTVARNTGFCSDSHFITTFKKRMGISPKKYIRESSKL